MGTGASGNYVGGFVGYNDASGTLSGVSNPSTNNVYAPNYNYVGGVAGNNAGSFTNVYNVANVTGNTNVGGLAGYNTGTITATASGLTYASGVIIGSSNVGGAIGWNLGSVNNASFSGTVTGAGVVGAFIADENAGGSYTNTSVSNTTLTGLPGNNYFTLNVNQILNNISVNGISSGTNTLDYTGYANTVVATMSGTNNGVAVANGIRIATFNHIRTLTGNPGFGNILIPTTHDYTYLIRTSTTSGYFTDPLTYTSFYVAGYLGSFAPQAIGETFDQAFAGPVSTINQGTYESNAVASNVPFTQVNNPSPQWLIIGDQQYTIINNLERPVMIQNGYLDTDGMEDIMLPVNPYKSLTVQIINGMGNHPAAKTSLLQPLCGVGKVCLKELSFY
jgi:hypothetical protein